MSSPWVRWSEEAQGELLQAGKEIVANLAHGLLGLGDHDAALQVGVTEAPRYVASMSSKVRARPTRSWARYSHPRPCHEVRPGQDEEGETLTSAKTTARRLPDGAR